jgi:vanillate O-demethylase ferredoxin subunit
MLDTFIVRLRKAGLSVEVGPDESIVDALSRIGVYHPVSCGGGVCGVCLARVVSGEPDHRDFLLNDREREASLMVLCCSRSLSPLLELDI